MPAHTRPAGLRRRQLEHAGQFPTLHLLLPGVTSRIAARIRAHALDRKLADGADPAECARLAARAAQLTRPATRAHVATDLEHLLDAASRGAGPGRVRPSRLALSANRGSLAALAATLRGSQPVYARGMAELRLLVRDGAGPIYMDRRGEGLARAIAKVDAGLRG